MFRAAAKVVDFLLTAMAGIMLGSIAVTMIVSPYILVYLVFTDKSSPTWIRVASSFAAILASLVLIQGIFTFLVQFEEDSKEES